MIAESLVTVWHFDEDGQVPNRRVFKGVHLDGSEKISKNGIKQRGFFDAKSYVVRIPTTENMGIIPEDYLAIGEISDEFPDAEKTLKIMEVKDNRRGGQPHWRIVCGG